MRFYVLMSVVQFTQIGKFQRVISISGTWWIYLWSHMPIVLSQCLTLRIVSIDWAIDNDVELTIQHLPKKQQCRPKKVRMRWPNKNESDESVKVSQKVIICFVETTANKATTFGVVPNQTIQIGSNSLRRLRRQNQTLT